MSQPTDFDYATDDTYTSGPDMGLPTKVEPSTGRRATGMRRDDFFSAAVDNWMKNNLGRGIDGLADIAACNWGPLRRVDTTPATPVPQTATRLVPARIVFSGPPTVTRQLLIYADTTTGRLAYAEADVENAGLSESFNDITSSGLAATQNPVAGEVSGAPYIIQWDPGTGVVKKMTSLGTWAAAGTVNTDEGYILGTWFAKTGRWFVARRAHVAYSDALANSAWTEVDLNGIGWTGAPPPSPTCISSGSDGVAIGLAADHIVYSQDGVTWQWISQPGGCADVAFSESRQEWVAIKGDGTIVTAPVGMSVWTSRGNVGAGNGNAIKAFGRAYVATTESGLYVAKSADGPWVRLMTSAGSALRLVRSNGRLLAYELVSASDLYYYLYPSLRAPFEVF